VQVFTGYGGAAACDVFIVALHGFVKKTDRLFVRQLLNSPAMRGKRVRGKLCGCHEQQLLLQGMVCAQAPSDVASAA
jgi:hypothetical protein